LDRQRAYQAVSTVTEIAIKLFPHVRSNNYSSYVVAAVCALLKARLRRLKYFAWLSRGAAVKYRLLRLLHWRTAVSLDTEIVVAEMEFLQQPPPAIVL
jgi:hypothetical protein